MLSEEKRIYASGEEVVVGYHYEQGSFVPIAQEVDGELQYIVTDHLGTPKEVYSEEGELIWSAKHELWGKVSKVTHLKAANDNPVQDCIIRFQGQIEDEESGLYYNRFRYYDPESGNYTQADPIGLAGGLRLHEYVNSSTLWIDPFGLVGEDLIGKTGSYSELRADLKKQGISGNDINVDHIPSNASNIKAWELEHGTKPSKQMRKKIRDNGNAMYVKAKDHQKISETYGGRNNKSKQLADALDPNAAIDSNLQKYVDADVIDAKTAKKAGVDLKKSSKC